MSNRSAHSYLAIGLPLLALAFLFFGPLLAILAASFTERAPNGGIDWSGPVFDAYTALFYTPDLFGELEPNRAFLSAFSRSLYLATCTTLICLVAAIPMAIYISRRSERTKTLLLLLITIPFWANLLARNYAWILILRANGLLDSALQSIWPGFEGTGLLYSETAILIGLVYSFLPFMVLPIFASAERFDWDLVSASRDLGASVSRTYGKVVLPLLTPGILAGSILVFIPSMGNFITPQLLGGGQDFMLGNLIALQFGASRNWAHGAAIAVGLMIGISLVLLCLRRLGPKGPHLSGGA